LKNGNPSSPDADPAHPVTRQFTANAQPASPQIPLVLALFFGAAFAAAGVLVYATLLGYMPGEPAASDVPPAILWLAGTVFFSAGLGMMLFRILPKLAGICALIALCAFVAIFNWIAFGPGERNFTKRTTTGGGGMSASKQEQASATEGRLVFGLFAGALDALILFGLYKSLTHRSGNKRGPTPSDPRNVARDEDGV